VLALRQVSFQIPQTKQTQPELTVLITLPDLFKIVTVSTRGILAVIINVVELEDQLQTGVDKGLVIFSDGKMR
jgi:hypothetical protein